MQTRQVIAAAIVMLASGCLGGLAPKPENNGDANTSMLNEQTRLDLTLDDFNGSDVLVLEIYVMEGHQLQAETSAKWPLGGENDPCLANYLGSKGTVLFGPGMAFVAGSSRVAEQAIIRQGNPTGASLEWHDLQETSGTGPEPIPVVIGLRGVDYWRQVGGTFNVTIQSDVPFRWRALEAGHFECLTRLDEFPQGEWTELPYVKYGRSLAKPFEIAQSGHAWAVVSSDAGYKASLEHQGEAVWHAQQPMGGSPGCASHVAYEMPMGAWSLSIQEIQGKDAKVSFLAMDLPPWITNEFHKAADLRPDDGASGTGCSMSGRQQGVPVLIVGR